MFSALVHSKYQLEFLFVGGCGGTKPDVQTQRVFSCRKMPDLEQLVEVENKKVR